MSRIGDDLYFAPNITFSQLDWKHGKLPSQFSDRIDGFYLKPAKALANRREGAFGAGLLVVCGIDALAHVITGTSGVTARIEGFCARIPDLKDKHHAELFCSHFRNGLVHEARVKNGSEFSAALERTAAYDRGRLIINPLRLAEEVQSILREHIAYLHGNVAANKAFHARIKRRFRSELEL